MAVSFIVVDNSYSSHHQSEIKTEATFLAAAVESNGMEFIRNTDKQTDTRITWVAKDGTVLYDNKANAAYMENEASYPDVQSALENGVGESQGHYAVRLSTNGTVLRVSVENNVVSSMISEMIVPTIIIIAMAIILSIIIASVLSTRLLRPVNEIDLESPDERGVYDELKPFISRINAQNKQIHKQMEQLKEEHKKQDDLRREFTANVSHELKTPLTTISGYAELIRDGIAKPEDIPKFAGSIYDEAGRLMVLVGDILRLSQMDSGDPQVGSKTDVDLLNVCGAVAERLQPVAEKAGVEIRVNDSGQERIMVNAVPAMLDEIVFNLCENAVKYNRAGGMVDVIAERAADNVVLTVKDTGIGISPKDQERIFERFYRVDKSHSKSVGGTGLGLSIVKHSARFNNASVVLESEPDKGTVVKVIFRRKN